MNTEARNKLDAKKIVVKPLDRDINRAAFSCGLDFIDNFFRNNARKHHDESRVKCYVALNGADVVGYYWLVASSKDPDKISDKAREKFGRVGHAPCVYLGMIGVQLEHQGCGIGKRLMADALERTAAVADIVGVYALVLDAVDQEKADTYAAWGFEYFDANVVLDDGSIPMFIPINTIKDGVAKQKMAMAAPETPVSNSAAEKL